jgi:1-acyl-sn-glycerol-3-phosphate acyltransferase
MPIPVLPPNAPRTHNPLGRALGRFILWCGGWRIVGEFPDVPKLMMLAAPHSSGWDAVWGLAAKLAMGLRISFMAKKELFWFPLGNVLRALGAVPTDRSSPRGVVVQMADQFERPGPFWLLLAPEGTRRRVDKWKTGFWRIATAAEVPVFCAWFHYPDRTIGLGEVFTMTGDLETDMATLRAYYAPYVGKHRGTV